MRKSLQRQMPGYVARALARAVTRSQVQQQASDNWAAILDIVGTITEVATADTRSWDVQPQGIFVVRAELPSGDNAFQAQVTGTPFTPLWQQTTLEPGFNFAFIQAR